MNGVEPVALGEIELRLDTGATPPIHKTSTRRHAPNILPTHRVPWSEKLFGALCIILIITILVLLQVSYRADLLSQLNAEILEYGAYVLLGLVLIRFADRIIKIRRVRVILIAALLSLLLSAVFNLSNNIHAFDAWPLLGAQSRLNFPVKYTFETASIILVLAAVYSAVVALRNARDELQAGQSRLLDEISHRKEVEDGLRDSEEKYRSLFENAAVGVLIADRDGRILVMNRSMVRLLGNWLDQPDASTFWQALRDETARENLLDTMTHLGQVDGFECEIESGTNETKWVSLSAARLTYEGKQAYQITAFDVTRRKQAETEKAGLEDQYRQAQKMEAVGQLTGGIAHDFNNLLQVISWGIETASCAIPIEDDAYDSVMNASKASERAARLVSQLLLFSRRQIMQPKPLDMNETIAGLLKMLGRIIGEHINLRWHPGTGIGMVNADQGMVEQALMNLCINARDAMPDGGKLTLSTACVELSPGNWPSITPVTPGEYVVVSVEDDGCGMDPTTRARIFEPFFTTKEQGKGTGLGLSTVYGIRRQHGGTAHVYSELGKGSVFRLYWPVTTAETADDDSEAPVPAPRGTETILLAEDDELVRGMTQTLLEAAGYRVLGVANGEEAVSLYASRADEIDMVLLDVVMPQMGGREAYERIKRIRPNAKSLFASGYSPDAIHTNFVLDAKLHLIRKPFHRDELLFAVRDVLDNAVPTTV